MSRLRGVGFGGAVVVLVRAESAREREVARRIVAAALQGAASATVGRRVLVPMERR
jgi:galactokinase